MPIRFSTEAANADHMRMDADAGVPEGSPDNIGGADGTPRDRADSGVRSKRATQRDPKGAAHEAQDSDEAAKPGKDINAAGFVKDKDADKP